MYLFFTLGVLIVNDNEWVQSTKLVRDASLADPLLGKRVITSVATPLNIHTVDSKVKHKPQI